MLTVGVDWTENRIQDQSIDRQSSALNFFRGPHEVRKYINSCSILLNFISWMRRLFRISAPSVISLAETPNRGTAPAVFFFSGRIHI